MVVTAVSLPESSDTAKIVILATECSNPVAINDRRHH